MFVAMIGQAIEDMKKDKEVDGFPSGMMAALDFFHSPMFSWICDELNLDESYLTSKIGVPSRDNCTCYQCRKDYTREATAVAKHSCGEDYWFLPNTRHIVEWKDDLIVRIIPENGDKSTWMSPQEFLKGTKDAEWI